MLHHSWDDDKEESLGVISTRAIFKNAFSPWMAESTDAESVNIEDQLYSVKPEH